jgi:hypothetical protein
MDPPNLAKRRTTDAATFLGSLVDEVAEIAVPVAEWNARRRQKQLSIAAHS